MAVFNNILAGASGQTTEAGPYQISRSLRFNSSDSAYLSRTPSTAGNRKTWTWSGWVKRANLGYQIIFTARSGQNYHYLSFDTNDELAFRSYSGGWQMDLQTTAKFRDPSSWYHILINVNTTASTSSDRASIYVNGTKASAFNTATYPSQNADLQINATYEHNLGRFPVANDLGNFLLADVHFIDGQALDPTSFTEVDATTGQLVPKAASISSPNNETIWSDSGSSSATLENGNWGQAFDGTQYVYSGSGPSRGPALSNGSITFSPSGLSGRVVTAGVRGGSNKTYTVNGSAMTFGSSSYEVATIDLGSVQSITSVVGTSTASGVWAQFYWIAVDGVVLVDGVNEYGINGFHLPFSDNSTAAALGTDTSGAGNDWDVYNISTSTGGPTSVAAASGALPIYNTTDTYGTVKGTGTRADANSSSIELAVAMDGTNNGTTFTDESAAIKGSGTARTITRSGNPVTSTTNSKFYGSSGYFDGSGYLEVSGTLFGSGPWTFECWLNLDDSSEPFLKVGADTGSTFTISNTSFQTDGDGVARLLYTGQNFGISANTWFHFALVNDGTNPPRPYVNGIAAIGNPVRGTAANTAPSGTLRLGDSRSAGGALNPYNGYMQDVRFYSTAKYTSNFTPPSSTQNPTVAAGNDSLVDTPTNGSQTDTGAGGEVVGNYATLNPLFIGNGQGTTLSNGNLDYLSTASSGQYATRFNTIGVSSDKWYFEFTINAIGNGLFLGISSDPGAVNNYIGQNTTSWGYLTNGTKWTNGGSSSYGASYTSGDVIGVALDLDAGTISFYKNGASQGTAYSSLPTGTYFIGISGTTNVSVSCNFGQRPFAHPVSGYKALCTANLDDPLVAQPSTVMDVVKYDGTSSTQTIPNVNTVPTTLGFGPDLVWIKNRTAAWSHILSDTVRGSSLTLFSDSTSLEQSRSDGITAFNSDGFDVGPNDGTTTRVTNAASDSYVAWCWDAGSAASPTTYGPIGSGADVEGAQYSITSTVRANASAGFSIVTGTTPATNTFTIGHGLNAEPYFIVVKVRNQAYNWDVYHKSLGNTGRLVLNLTNSSATYANVWGSTTPTSSVFTMGGNGTWYNNGDTFVAYAFAPVDGYSAFGSYTGNGSATDGPFIYTGFRPRWILFKNASSSTYGWYLLDTARNEYNVAATYIFPDSSDAEGTASVSIVDFLSNGFKPRAQGGYVNTSGDTYIYAAFAESPQKYSRAR